MCVFLCHLSQGENGIIIIIIILREFEFPSGNSQTILGMFKGSHGLGLLEYYVSLNLSLNLSSLECLLSLIIAKCQKFREMGHLN